jgi:MraZ protein
MFKGTVTHSLDAKGRIAIPNKLRQQIEKTGDTEILIITQGTDGCLFAYTPNEWKKFEQKASQLSLLDETASTFRRFFIAPAAECTLDKLGRIMIPGNLREFAEITKEVVITGVADKIEIWSKINYDKYWKEFKNSEIERINKIKDIGL